MRLKKQTQRILQNEVNSPIDITADFLSSSSLSLHGLTSPRAVPQPRHHSPKSSTSYPISPTPPHPQPHDVVGNALSLRCYLLDLLSNGPVTKLLQAILEQATPELCKHWEQRIEEIAVVLLDVNTEQAVKPILEYAKFLLAKGVEEQVFVKFGLAVETAAGVDQAFSQGTQKAWSLYVTLVQESLRNLGAEAVSLEGSVAGVKYVEPSPWDVRKSSTELLEEEIFHSTLRTYNHQLSEPSEVNDCKYFSSAGSVTTGASAPDPVPSSRPRGSCLSRRSTSPFVQLSVETKEIEADSVTVLSPSSKREPDSSGSQSPAGEPDSSGSKGSPSCPFDPRKPHARKINQGGVPDNSGSASCPFGPRKPNRTKGVQNRVSETQEKSPRAPQDHTLLSVQEVALVQSSFALVEEEAATLAPKIWEEFLSGSENRSSVSNLFYSSLDSHVLRFIDMLGRIIGCLHLIDPLSKMLHELGKRHQQYGVTAAHYAPLGEAMLKVFESVLGEVFDLPTRKAWTKAYDLISKSMIDAGNTVMFMSSTPSGKLTAEGLAILTKGLEALERNNTAGYVLEEVLSKCSLDFLDKYTTAGGSGTLFIRHALASLQKMHQGHESAAIEFFQPLRIQSFDVGYISIALKALSRTLSVLETSAFEAISKKTWDEYKSCLCAGLTKLKESSPLRTSSPPTPNSISQRGPRPPTKPLGVSRGHTPGPLCVGPVLRPKRTRMDSPFNDSPRHSSGHDLPSGIPALGSVESQGPTPSQSVCPNLSLSDGSSTGSSVGGDIGEFFGKSPLVSRNSDNAQENPSSVRDNSSINSDRTQLTQLRAPEVIRSRAPSPQLDFIQSSPRRPLLAHPDEGALSMAGMKPLLLDSLGPREPHVDPVDPSLADPYLARLGTPTPKSPLRDTVFGVSRSRSSTPRKMRSNPTTWDYAGLKASDFASTSRPGSLGPIATLQKKAEKRAMAMDSLVLPVPVADRRHSCVDISKMGDREEYDARNHTIAYTKYLDVSQVMVIKAELDSVRKGLIQIPNMELLVESILVKADINRSETITLCQCGFAPETFAPFLCRVIAGFHDSATVVRLLEDFGRKLRKYNIKGRHLSALGEALLHELPVHIVGNIAVECAAWWRVWAFISNVMLNAMHENNGRGDDGDSNASPKGCITLDNEGNILALDTHLMEQLQYKFEEVRGIHISKLAKPLLGDEEYPKDLKLGRIPNLDVLFEHLVLLCANGSRLRTEMSVLVNCTDNDEFQCCLMVRNIAHSLIPLPIHETKNVLLQRMFPGNLLQGMLKNPTNQMAHKFEAGTVCFLGICGFANLYSTLPSYDVVTLLHEIIAALDELAKVFDVVKIKTVGDTYIAASNLKGMSSGTTESLACWSLFVPDVVRHIIAKKKPGNACSIYVKGGMSTGDFHGGILGKDCIQFDVIGDAVKNASQLVSESLPGKVTLCSSTYDVLSSCECFEFTSRETENSQMAGATYCLEGLSKDKRKVSLPHLTAPDLAASIAGVQPLQVFMFHNFESK